MVCIRLCIIYVLLLCRSIAHAKSTIDQEHAETLRLAKEEQKALEAAISKSHKKLKEANSAAAVGS